MKRICLARRRKVIGLSQEGLAEQLGIDRSTVIRWEHGETQPQPWQRPNLAAALKVSLEELDWLLVQGDGPMSAQPLAPWAFHQTQSDPPADDFATMKSLRLADRQVGGGQLYATVTGYLQFAVAPRLFGTHASADNDELFAAAAGLTEMAGWMAHDAGHDDAAERHLQRALGLAVVANDSQLWAHVSASLSHLSCARKQAARAVLHAQRGHQHLGTPQQHCVVQARLSVMEARSHAILGDEKQCTGHLRLAEDALQREPSADRSPWISDFDAAAFATEAARCFRDLGRLDSAKHWADQVVALRAADRPRSRAYAQLLAASVLIAQGKIDEACAVGYEVLAATRELNSVPVLRQLGKLGRALHEHRRRDQVGHFLGLLGQELAARRQRQGVASS